MTVGAEGSCPRRVATVLHLGPDGLIQAEERLHRIDDLQRCQGALPSGWWDSAVVPDPVLVERTGTLTVGDLEIEVYNGTPGLEDLITWSFDQFRTHGLGTPKVRRVTFHDNQIDKCEGVAGLILGDAVTLCFDSAAACRDQDCTTWQTWAKKTSPARARARVDGRAPDPRGHRAVPGRPPGCPPGPARSTHGASAASNSPPRPSPGRSPTSPVPVNPELGRHSCDELSRYYEILTGRPPEPTPPGCEPTRQADQADRRTCRLPHARVRAAQQATELRPLNLLWFMTALTSRPPDQVPARRSSVPLPGTQGPGLLVSWPEGRWRWVPAVGSRCCSRDGRPTRRRRPAPPHRAGPLRARPPGVPTRRGRSSGR